MGLLISEVHAFHTTQPRKTEHQWTQFFVVKPENQQTLVHVLNICNMRGTRGWVHQGHRTSLVLLVGRHGAALENLLETDPTNS